ncbi:diguanylate cyclase (GGDEF)-like protein [Sporomusa sp. KB1]|nr:diguanylate cyclase (GGDEF)-like protein [Sporomusa sp. KB1]
MGYLHCKLRLLVLVMMLIPQGVVFGLANGTGLASDRWFNQIEAVSLVSALLLALATPGLIIEWLLGKPLEKIRCFCFMVKQGDYRARVSLPNESRDRDDEDAITLLMRDMNWMARQIELREQELKQVVENLEQSRQHIGKQNQALAKTNAELMVVQGRLNERTTELEEAFKQMQVMALTDPLTTIGNRRCFFDTLEQQFAALICTCRPISLVMIDIDRFKAINDTFGHEAGDRVLQELARIIIQHSRENDLAARIGGEEFTVLLPGAGSQEAVLVARRIKAAIANHNFELADEQRISITVSIGICTLSQTPCFNRDNLYNYADQALYHSKNNGRNSISIFDPTIRSVTKVS